MTSPSSQIETLSHIFDKMIFGFVLIFGLVVALAPKSLALLAGLLGVFCFLSLIKQPKLTLPYGSILFKTSLLFWLWLALSLLWVDDLPEAAQKFLQLSGFFIFSVPILAYAHSGLTQIQARQMKYGALASYLLAWVLTTCIVFWPQSFVAALNGFNETLSQASLNIQMQNYVSLSNRAITILTPLAFVFVPLFVRPFFLRLLAMAGLAFVIYHSNNQSALLGLFLPLGFMLVTLPKKNWRVRGFIAALGLGAVLMVPLTQLNYAQQWAPTYLKNTIFKKASLSQRSGLYYAYGSAILEKPILGYGLDSSSSADFGDEPYNLWQGKNPPHHPHNYFLQLWFELGAIGFGLGLVLLALMARHLAQLALKTDEPYWDTSLLPFYLSTLSIGFFAYNIWQSWLLGGILISVFISIKIKK